MHIIKLLLSIKTISLALLIILNVVKNPFFGDVLGTLRKSLIRWYLVTFRFKKGDILFGRHPSRVKACLR